MIDYGIASLMMPTVLIGSFIGAFFNVALPAPIINIFLTIVLFILALYSLWKAIRIYKLENVER